MRTLSGLFFSIFFLSTTSLYADIGTFDLFKVQYQGKEYHLMLESGGQLKDNDLCYYSTRGEYRMEVQDYMEGYLLALGDVRLYETVEAIRVDQLVEKGFIYESPIHIMKGLRVVPLDSFMLGYELLGASHGNTYGTMVSASLTEQDHSWINSDSIEQLFTIGNDFCFYGFFSAAVDKDADEVKHLQEELHTWMLKEEEIEAFHQKIDALVEQRIIMLGGCSC